MTNDKSDEEGQPFAPLPEVPERTYARSEVEEAIRLAYSAGVQDSILKLVPPRPLNPQQSRVFMNLVGVALSDLREFPEELAERVQDILAYLEQAARHEGEPG